jgi:hypothetical protein
VSGVGWITYSQNIFINFRPMSIFGSSLNPKEKNSNINDINRQYTGTDPGISSSGVNIIYLKKLYKLI